MHREHAGWQCHAPSRFPLPRSVGGAVSPISCWPHCRPPAAVEEGKGLAAARASDTQAPRRKPTLDEAATLGWPVGRSVGCSAVSGEGRPSVPRGRTLPPHRTARRFRDARRFDGQVRLGSHSGRRRRGRGYRSPVSTLPPSGLGVPPAAPPAWHCGRRRWPPSDGPGPSWPTQRGPT